MYEHLIMYEHGEKSGLKEKYLIFMKALDLTEKKNRDLLQNQITYE